MDARGGRFASALKQGRDLLTGLRSVSITLLAAALAAPAARAVEVALDVGHYDTEPGVISASGRPEFEFNRELAFEVKSQLEKVNIPARLIGERGDHAVLAKRTAEAKGADLFLSIHHDSVRERWLPRAREFAGFSLFISRKNSNKEKSLTCASAVGARLRAAGFTPSLYHADRVRGENRPFADKRNGVHYYDNLAVAKSAAMPAVLLEAGVIVNPAEESRLRDPEVRRRIAAAAASGVAACLR